MPSDGLLVILLLSQLKSGLTQITLFTQHPLICCMPSECVHCVCSAKHRDRHNH